MEVQIYTTPGCGYCVKVKELLNRANLSFDQTVVGRDLTREEFKSKYPQATGFPYVIIDGNVIGGLVETVKFLVEKGLVSSRK
jgi:glutaredoxin 3